MPDEIDTHWDGIRSMLCDEPRNAVLGQVMTSNETEGEEDDPCVWCQEQIGHRALCPVPLNLYPVLDGMPVQCFLCDAWLSEGTKYRLLPTLPEDAEGADLDQPFWWEPGSKSVCTECATLRLVR